VYPAVVESGGPSSITTMGAAMTTATRYTLAVFMPVTVATVALAPLVIGVVYGRGAFDREAIRTTVAVAVAFAPMLLLTMIQPVLVAAHNARRRGMLMGLTAVSNAFLNVVLDLAFGSVLGAVGIALSSSVTLAILLLFLTWRVPADEGFRIRDVADAAGRSFAASLVPGIPIGAVVWWLTRDGIVAGGLPILIVCAIMGAIGYLLATKLFRLPEPWIMLGVLGEAMKRRFARGPLP
jgi:putative peptidoglycan lipid II flippase